MKYEAYSYKSIRVFYNPERVENADVFITGFKGFGSVGYITTLHLVEKLSCSIAGYIVTKYMPEEATPDYSGSIASAFTLYGCNSGERRIVILVNHDIPVPQERTRFSEAIIRWVSRAGIPEAVLVGGFDSRFREGSEDLRWIATSVFARKLSEPTMQQGLYVIGPLALLLVFAEIHSYPAIAILPYAEAARPDPRAAAVAVRKISELYGVSVGVEDLLEEARKIEEMINMLEKQQREALSPPSSERVYM